MVEEIKRLAAHQGVSGNESAIAAYVREQVLPLADKVYTDALGNLVAVRKGDGPRMMLLAHMDELGLAATFADANGFLRVAAVGPVDPKVAVGRPVRFENGVMGVFYFEEEAKELKIEHCFVDIGAKNKEEALVRVPVGTTASFIGETFETGSCIVSHSLESRVGCYCLIETLKRLKNCPAELYVVFTVQREAGQRGAKVSGFEIAPEVAIAVDSTPSHDQPGSIPRAAVLGKGTAIRIRDRSAVCGREVVEDLENLAKRKSIAAQRDVLEDQRSNLGALQLLGKGVQVGALGIPVRYGYSAAEMANQNDIEATIDLLTVYLEK